MGAAIGETCELCGRCRPLTEHHLLPRAVHRRKRYVRRFGKAEMKHRKVMVCRLCHDGIHAHIPDEKLLADEYNTRELLLGHEGLRRHIEWARRQKS
jgi:hypothetical protein